MGGRGSSGGGVGGSFAGLSKYESIVAGPYTIRIPYSKYKNEYNGVRSIRDSYDSASKTIEVKVSPVTRTMMDIVPESFAKEFPSHMSKYQIAASVHNQFRDMVDNGEKMWSGMEKWQKDGYNLARVERLMQDGKYKTLKEAIAATKPTKPKKRKK